MASYPEPKPSAATPTLGPTDLPTWTRVLSWTPVPTWTASPTPIMRLDPIAPYDTSIGAVSIAGTTALVARGPSLFVVDVTDLARPNLLGRLTAGHDQGIAFDGDGRCAFVANSGSGVHCLTEDVTVGELLPHE